jgi:hypothetical protein
MNDVSIFHGQKVAKAFAHLDPNKSLGANIAGGFSSLNYRGKNWSLVHQGQTYPFKRDDDDSPLTYIDVIVVGENPNTSKMYYPPGDWSEDAAGAPVCMSLNGVRPEPGVKERQSELCSSCKWFGWTTLPNGNRGKICQDHKRLAVLLMPAFTKKLLGAPLIEPVYLKVPPGSLNALHSYGEMLKHEGFPFAAVVTRISFSSDKLFQMVFEGKKALSDVEAPLVLPLVESPQTKRIIGEAPEIRDVTPKPAAKEEKFDTGLEEAFASAPVKTAPAPATNGSGAEPEIIPPVKKQRGRPAKAAFQHPNPGAGEELKAELKDALPETTVQLNEEDTEFDNEIANLLNMKTDNMLK